MVKRLVNHAKDFVMQQAPEDLIYPIHLKRIDRPHEQLLLKASQSMLYFLYYLYPVVVINHVLKVPHKVERWSISALNDLLIHVQVMISHFLEVPISINAVPWYDPVLNVLKLVFAIQSIDILLSYSAHY